MTRPNPMPQATPMVFDRSLVRLHRDRAARQFHQHNALFAETDALLLERMQDIRRTFSSILNLGAHEGVLASTLGQKNDKTFLVSTNLSGAMLPQQQMGVISDEEFLPFAANSFDLIISSLALHWTNDLPGALMQIKNCLRPGGAFLAALIGGDSLHELRGCLMEAEIQVTGGVSPRVSPTVDLLTMSHLLQRAGFDLPVVDLERVTMFYPDMMTLMHDLRGMGEGNANLQRLKRPTDRKLFTEAERLYRMRFGDKNRQIPTSFDIVFIHGWKC